MNVYIADITKLYDIDTLEKYIKNTPHICINKVKKGKAICKIAASVGAYALLYYGLKHMGLTTKEEIKFTEKGKPYFADNNIFFNLSHSGDYAVCIIDDVDVGIDIEKVRAVRERLSERFFTEEEARKINKATCPKEALISAWTIKESFAKAKGSTILEELSKGHIEPTEKKDIFTAHNSEYYIKLINDVSGYKMSVCRRGDEQDIVLNKVEL